jgi:hypothetical protein
MTNRTDHPNHLHISADPTVGYSFGNLLSVTPIVLGGDFHHPHIAVRFRYGLCLELDAADAIELARRLPESVAMLPMIPDMHDAVGSDE